MTTIEPERLHKLIDVGRTLLSELGFEALLQRILDVARDLTGAQYAALGILDDRREGLDRFLTLGIDEGDRGVIGDLPRGRGVLGELISHPAPLRLTEVSEHPRSYGFPLGHPPMHTFLGVPILLRGEAWGNLYLTEKAGGEHFTEGDEEALVILADWAAIAIVNARLYREVTERRDELERAVRSLEATNEITRALGGELELERILELIAKRGRALVEARAVVIGLIERDGLCIAAAAGRLLDELRAGRLVLEEGVLGEYSMRTGKSQRIGPSQGAMRSSLAQRLGATSELVVPLRYRDRLLGIMAAFDQLGEHAEFSAEHEALMQAFATSAATAVATGQQAMTESIRVRHEASERERSRWARELHDDTLQDLGALRLMLQGARQTTELAPVHSSIEESVELIADAIERLRALIADLRPVALDEAGIGAALAALAERTQANAGLDVTLDVRVGEQTGDGGGPRLPSEVEVTAYRVVQESLANVVRHADASRAEVSVRLEEGELRVAVRDDGRGFDASQPPGGFGLLGMRERVALAGGTLALITSPGEGTAVTTTLPAEPLARARSA